MRSAADGGFAGKKWEHWNWWITRPCLGEFFPSNVANPLIENKYSDISPGNLRGNRSGLTAADCR